MGQKQTSQFLKNSKPIELSLNYLPWLILAVVSFTLYTENFKLGLWQLAGKLIKYFMQFLSYLKILLHTEMTSSHLSAQISFLTHSAKRDDLKMDRLLKKPVWFGQILLIILVATIHWQHQRDQRTTSRMIGW